MPLNIFFDPAFLLAHETSLFTFGKYLDNMIKPGIPKTHPWKTGINPPIKPIITNKIPKLICKYFLIIYRSEIRLFDRNCFKSDPLALFNSLSKNEKTISFIIGKLVDGERFPTSRTYLTMGEKSGMSV